MQTSLCFKVYDKKLRKWFAVEELSFISGGTEIIRVNVYDDKLDEYIVYADDLYPTDCRDINNLRLSFHFNTLVDR